MNHRLLPLVLLPLLLLFVALLPSNASAGRSIVAVFAVESQGVKLEAEALSRLTSYVSSKLAAGGRYGVVPRDKIRAALRAQKKESYKDCYAESCQIAIGQELAADKSLAVKLIKFGSKCIVTATLYDLKRSASEAAQTMTGGCGADDLLDVVDKTIAALATAQPPSSAGAGGAAGKPFFGVSVSPPTIFGEVVGDAKGVFVTLAVPGGSAARAGLRWGDLITHVNNVPTQTPAQFVKLIQGRKVGETLVVRLLRKRKPLSLAVTLGSIDDAALGALIIRSNLKKVSGLLYDGVRNAQLGSLIAGAKLPIAPGRYKVALRKPGRRSVTRWVDVVAGRTSTVTGDPPVDPRCAPGACARWYAQTRCKGVPAASCARATRRYCCTECTQCAPPKTKSR